MDKKQYYSDLLYLFESVGMAGTEEVVPQEQIADTGSDVMAQNPVAGMQQPMMDSAMMQQQMMMPMSSEYEDGVPEDGDDTKLMEKQKFVKLFELFEDLLEYGEAFSETIRYVDINLLDEAIFTKMREYVNNLSELNDKIKNYLQNVFNHEVYEKVLYAYVTFRTEFIIAIKGLRHVLNLDNVENSDDIIGNDED